MPGRLEWFQPVEEELVALRPQLAHMQAASYAAGQAADGIQSTYTGTLAREVSTPADMAPMYSQIGSGAGGRSPLPYGRIEHYGGTIQGRPLLYIHDRRPRGSTGRVNSRVISGRSSTRSTYAGPVVAVVRSVEHKGKHYLDRGLEAYIPAFIKAYLALGGL